MAAQPEVTVELTLSDRIVDLIEEGYDLAVRIARLADSSLIARRLAPCRMVVCASPAYLERQGRPQRPDDLASHDYLGYSYGQARDEWRFDGPEGAASVRVRGTLQANNGDVLRTAALRGVGVVPAAELHCRGGSRRWTPRLAPARVPRAGARQSALQTMSYSGSAFIHERNPL